MELREETIESTEAFSGRLVKLRVDGCAPRRRRQRSWSIEGQWRWCRWRILHVVMVRQFRQAAGEVLLEIPAGTLDPNEDPAVCAARELREEVGCIPGKLTLMFKSYLAPGYSSEMLHTYLAENLTRINAEPEPDEFLEIVEVAMHDAVGLIRSGEIKDAKIICGILMAQRYQRSAE